MAAKMIRQRDQLALVGAPTSAAARTRGMERAPAALRAAGLADRLRAAGYQVSDGGDAPEQLFDPDPDNPRARNLRHVMAMLEALRPRIEAALKSRALPIVLGGDSTVSIALVAGLRRQVPNLGFIHVSGHADFHTPTQTEDGLVEPMVVSHLVGQGAAELLRYWNDPPLVREPDFALFGLATLDAAERDRLDRSAVRRYSAADIRRRGVKASAEAVLEALRADTREFVIHLGMDAVSAEEFPAGDRSSPGGLTLEELSEALACFAGRASLAGVLISDYNAALDADGRGAAIVADLVVSALTARLAAPAGAPTVNATAARKPAGTEPAPANGEVSGVLPSGDGAAFATDSEVPGRAAEDDSSAEGS